jgi:hypothetical protein
MKISLHSISDLVMPILAVLLARAESKKMR